MKVVQWLRELREGIWLICSYLRAFRASSVPDRYIALRCLTFEALRRWELLSEDKAGSWIDSLAYLLYRDGYPSLALELVSHCSRFPYEYSLRQQALYRWNCGDTRGAWELLVQLAEVTDDLPAWSSALSIACGIVDDNMDEQAVERRIPVGAVHFIRLVGGLMRRSPNESDFRRLLYTAGDYDERVRQWTAETAVRCGFFSLVSPADLEPEAAAVWYLWYGNVKLAARTARKAYFANRGAPIACLMKALLDEVLHRPQRAKRISERLLYPELTHGFVNRDRYVARAVSRCIWWNSDLERCLYEIQDAFDVSVKARDVVLLHFCACAADKLQERELVDHALDILTNWRIPVYPLLQRWQENGDPLAVLRE